MDERNIEEYELKFVKAVIKEFNQWTKEKEIEIPTSVADDIYSAIIEDFLELDVIETQEIFEKRYNRLLRYYFNEYYKKDKLIIFISLICHLVLEENLTLFFPRLEPTGKHYGNWAKAYPKNEKLGKLITQRLQYSHGREEITDFYYNAYIEFSESDAKKAFRTSIVRRSKKIPENTEKIVNENEEVKSVLKLLLGGSAAAILLTAIMKYLERKIEVWKPSEESTQAMLSICYVPGSLKLYGFCLEKPKMCPTDEIYYTPVYREELGGELASTYDKLPEFIKLFVALGNSTDPILLSLALKDNGDKIWHVLQNFLWLITQPYQKKSAKVNIWHDFTDMVIYPDVLNMSDLVEMEDGKFLLKGKHEIDLDMVVLVKKCLEIMTKEGITVHDQNRQLLNDLTERTQ